MNYIALLLVTLCFTSGAAYAAETPQQGHAPENERDRISYSIGHQIGNDLRSQGVDFDADTLLKGLEEGMNGSEPRLGREEMQHILIDLKKRVVEMKKAELVEKEKEQLKVKEEYRGEGRDFLERNREGKGVITLPSGLQYTVISEGTGNMPGPNDSVKVHYRGTLVDGTEFGSSYHEGLPVTLRVDGVIPGLREALQLMKEGGRWRLFIPADLAYGERGPLADRTVIYDIDLLSIESRKESSVHAEE